MALRMARKDAPPAPDSYRSLSYLYLRYGMVALIGLIFASIAVEIFIADDRCVQTSISAYYYSPVQMIFVGSLVAIGVCLVVIKGSNPWEDAFLNFAGVLAPVVAFVPTPVDSSHPHPRDCSSYLQLVPIKPQPGTVTTTAADDIATKNVANNMGAYLFIGLVVLVITAFMLYRAIQDEQIPAGHSWPDRYRWSYPCIVGLWVVGAAWFGWWLHDKGQHGPSFIDGAHIPSAILLFVFIIGVVFQNSIQLGRDGDNKTNPAVVSSGVWYWNKYTYVFLSMIAVAVGCFVASWTGWDYAIFAIEGGEILLFAVFWLIQTNDQTKAAPAPIAFKVAG